MKSGWSLDHYDVDKVDEMKKTILKTTFCGNAVILKVKYALCTYV